MYSTTIIAILGFCATQGLAAPRVELAVLPNKGSFGTHHYRADVLRRSPVVVETSSTGDAATDAKVGEELKSLGPELESSGKDLASLAEEEEQALPDLLEALEAAVAPLLEMAEVAESEVSMVQEAESDAEAANSTAYPSIIAPVRRAPFGELAARDPILGGLLKGVTSIIGLGKRDDFATVHARDPILGGLLKGVTSIIGLGKRMAAPEPEPEPFLGALAKGAATIVSLINKRAEELDAMRR